MPEEERAARVLEPAQLLAVVIGARVAVPELDGISALAQDRREAGALRRDEIGDRRADGVEPRLGGVSIENRGGPSSERVHGPRGADRAEDSG
jgi:hypothetical protein